MSVTEDVIVDIIMTLKQGFLVCSLGVLLWGSALAERDWIRYENAYFEAFSDDSPRNVLSDKDSSAWEERTARHEYAHVLLTYKNFRYPVWFRERFAELIASIADYWKNSSRKE